MAAASEINILDLFWRLSEDNDQEALWLLHKYYYPRIYRFIFSFVHHKEPAEEIANDVFIGIWQKRSLLLQVTRHEAYLFVCAKNLAMKYIKRRRLSTGSLDEASGIECVLVRNPHDMLISSEMLLRINKAIQDLPPKCRLIFILVKENNLKYREVADLLNVSEKTVENQMGIALKKLTASIPLSLFPSEKK